MLYSQSESGEKATVTKDNLHQARHNLRAALASTNRVAIHGDHGEETKDSQSRIHNPAIQTTNPPTKPPFLEYQTPHSERVSVLAVPVSRLQRVSGRVSWREGRYESSGLLRSPQAVTATTVAVSAIAGAASAPGKSSYNSSRQHPPSHPPPRRHTHRFKNHLDHQRAARTHRHVLTVTQVVDGNLKTVAAGTRVVVYLQDGIEGHVFDLDLVVNRIGHCWFGLLFGSGFGGGKGKVTAWCV